MGHGSLDPLFLHMNSYLAGIISAYYYKKSETNYIGELPLTRRGWRLNVVEGKRILAILTFEEHLAAGSEHGRTFAASSYPQIAEVDDPNEMAKLLRFGQIIDSRTFLFQANWLEKAKNSEISTPENKEAVENAREVGEEWGTALAIEHIARTRPDFEEP